jgi:hypothetical protein
MCLFRVTVPLDHQGYVLDVDRHSGTNLFDDWQQVVADLAPNLQQRPPNLGSRSLGTRARGAADNPLN